MKHLSFVVNTLKQRVEGVYKLLHSLLLQLPGDLVVMDPGVLECSKLRLRLRELVLDGDPHPAMIVEVLERFERHGVHGVRTNQFLDVQHIAVGWIFRARAGPQRPLDTRSLLLECRKARPAKQAFELLIDETSIGESNL